MALIKAVLDGNLTVSDIFKDRLATCTTCHACEASCPCNVPVAAIIQAAKEQALAELGPDFLGTIVSAALNHPAVLRATAWLAPVVLRYESAESRVQSRKVERSAFGDFPAGMSAGKSRSKEKKGRVAFFPGCAISAFQKDIGSAVMSVLRRLGYDAFIPEGLQCCGRPLLSLGDRAAARQLAERNAAVFTSQEADAIVTACASCGLTFKKEYPTLLRPGTKAPAVLDIHEFLAGALRGLSLGFVRKTVTVHIPCHLGRGQGLPRAVHDILRAVPGMQIVESENADRCCGFGGVMRITHHALSDGIAEEKARTLIAAGAAVVVTGCPGCRLQIGNALRRAGADIDVLHTVQVIDEALAMGEELETREASFAAR